MITKSSVWKKALGDFFMHKISLDEMNNSLHVDCLLPHSTLYIEMVTDAYNH